MDEEDFVPEWVEVTIRDSLGSVTTRRMSRREEDPPNGDRMLAWAMAWAMEESRPVSMAHVIAQMYDYWGDGTGGVSEFERPFIDAIGLKIREFLDAKNQKNSQTN